MGRFQWPIPTHGTQGPTSRRAGRLHAAAATPGWLADSDAAARPPRGQTDDGAATIVVAILVRHRARGAQARRRAVAEAAAVRSTIS
jgi:hypothetical protein